MKRYNFKRLFFIMTANVLAMFSIVFANNFPVSAASTVITQTMYSTDSVTMHWVKVPGAKEYYPAIAESKSEAEEAAKKHGVVLGDTEISYTFNSLKPGTIYYVALRCLYTDSKGDKEETVGTAIMKTIPGKVTGLTQAKWYSNKKIVYVTWDKQTAATFKYVFMDRFGRRIREGVSFKNSFSRRIDNNKCYSFKVRSVTLVGGKTYESEWSDRIYLFAQPMIKSYNYGNDFAVKIAGGSLNIKWDRVKYANEGYNIYVSKNRDKGYTLVGHASKKKSQKTIKRFKGSRFKKSGTYYIYVEGLRQGPTALSSTGIGYVWEYKNGKVRQTYYHGSYQ
ncbi:hypothetical protein [Butyrivibrio sp. AD3002]|uniref:hypothetical protein n=1 Tax=Butyrivibrio sp. AD3002 TaxID=1280670 RepID=UPI0003B344CA|nr:hypothetical protein [Butyrivibrio sp. AD3002]